MAAQPNKRDDGELLSIAAVAKLYGVSDETVRRWCRKGIIEYKIVGPFRAKRITRAEADKHLKDAPK